MNDEEIIEILADEYSRRILSATSKEALSALQLSAQLNIPRATVYRKIKSLEETGLLKAVKSVINPRGNEEKFYKSAIKKAVVSFKEGKLTAKLEQVEMDGFVRLWKVFSDRNIKAVKK